MLLIFSAIISVEKTTKERHRGRPCRSRSVYPLDLNDEVQIGVSNFKQKTQVYREEQEVIADFLGEEQKNGSWWGAVCRSAHPPGLQHVQNLLFMVVYFRLCPSQMMHFMDIHVQIRSICAKYV